ncbi:AAA domain protein [Bordetella bronchiseptica GA96-01]|uniref:TM0106 family RecB-like putative nuclease n=1 Tax=Bordetella bronchiseptica TaxID=518 RepID=UPI00045A85D7|nr:TM0106 family RecB-like putative nuclease [Bordetella bronchiseptica]AZW30935.1 nuclease [Bordetella bronchiseptica]KCV43385.1 AAA domain protein [Bordetella bronchiseptica 345]KDC35699.1 AAA domain protein [Bordetella bronchiseptica GA96-01]
MQQLGATRRYAASDLVGFLACEHLTQLDLRALDAGQAPAAADDEQMALVQAKGQAHEQAWLERLRARHPDLADVTRAGPDLAARLAATRAAMAAGAPVIYQAALCHGPYVGHADFLLRTERPSALGDYGYEALDTKLARSPRASFVLQLSFYAWLLEHAQGVAPRSMHVVLGSGRELALRVADYAHYLRQVLRRFEAAIAAEPAPPTYPEPCEHCPQCRWRVGCEARRVADDHLSLVAGMSRQQARRLNAQGVATLAQLGALPEHAQVAGVEAGTLQRLRAQAALQWRARVDGARHYELLAAQDEGPRGLARLPRPDPGDMFFDMEGDPLEDGGLEYLFGLYVVDDGAERFVPFWAHDRRQEKQAFEAFMDFVAERLRRHPDAHIYHYAPYEATALKKLMSLHGTREAEVDHLLRAGKLVDLYRVVREGLRISEPSYSIKYVERFYLPRRAGEVTNAGASIVYYERWKATGEPRLLQDIADYNRDDVVSTWRLRDWLCGIRPAGLPWHNEAGQQDLDAARAVIGEMTEAERRLLPYRAALADDLPADEAAWSPRDAFRALAWHLLDFHRREQKPAWWAWFARGEATDGELIEDAECLGGLVRDDAAPPVRQAQSLRYTYRYPAQETKLRTGARCTDVRTGASLANLVVDPHARLASFTCSARKPAPPPRMALGPAAPVNNKELVNAVFRYGDAVCRAPDGMSTPMRAVDALLRREPPRIRGLARGAPLVAPHAELLPQVLDVVARMDETTLFLQGPPGAGKTYTGSRVLLQLLRAGRRVAVSSNSHHAINNLLRGLERLAEREGFALRGAKKSASAGDDSCLGGTQIEDVFDNKDVDPARHQLVAGTAWLFARPEFEQAFDYLFVDEAGQVSLANLVAMGQCARNIVLLGDQMQLGQPSQGTHPGRSGESALEYLLDGQATIAASQGVFLDTSYRMHPEICGFISEAIYDGRLRAAPATAAHRLLLDEAAGRELPAHGIRYLPVPHDGNTQSSREEAARVAELCALLLRQRHVDEAGAPAPLTLDDILFVAPYNVQVNTLRAALPDGARVGTVDKFQGQEAQVVIVSMATSSGDYLPRDLEFLFSRNRLNVAISRARTLAILVASPALTAVRCRSAEQMALVNTLCWVAETGSASPYQV